LPVIIRTSQALGLEQKLAPSTAYAIPPKQDISRAALTALILGVMHHRASAP